MVDLTTILLVVTTILTGIFVWSRRTYVYWRRRRIKFVKPSHILGNLKEVVTLKRSFGLLLRDFYFDEHFRDEPLIGIYLFHQPALLIKDLELVRTVLIEDFVSFSNRFSKCDPHGDKLGALNLFFVKNPEWREIRTRLSSVFTGAKMKQMFSLMEEIGYDLETYLQKITEKHDRAVVQIKEVCDLYTTDLIASIAFGFRAYSLRNKQTEIGLHCRRIFQLNFRRAVNFGVIAFLPRLVTLLRPKLFTPEHRDFLRRAIRQALEERERNGVLRNDLIELLLTLKKEADLNSDRTHFTHHPDYLPAQAAVFEIAGIETCAATMAFALYELALHPKLQARLRMEIRKTFAECLDSLSYDKILSMQYLGMVVDETLRKYPIVPFLERECTPVNRKRFYSFRPQVDCLARRGTPIYISTLAIHHDEKYWPNPEMFDPERFSPQSRKLQVPLSYLPYGAGPHNCIGSSLGQLQIKLGLIHILRFHCVEVCEKTVEKINYDPKYALLSSEGGIYLNVVKYIAKIAGYDSWHEGKGGRKNFF